MGRWTEDFWGGDNELAAVRDVLIAARLLPRSACTTLQVLMCDIAGRNLICRMSPDDMRRVVDAMDNELTAAHLEALEPHFGELMCEHPFCGQADALWALLCMHVGAAVPEHVARGAEEAFAPDARGRWGNSPDAKKLAAAYLRELRAYTPGITGRVRFPAEMPWTLAAAGRSRYLRYQIDINGKTEPHELRGQAPWSVVLRRSCGYCGRLADDLRACGRCRAVHYCDAECQAAAWKAHKQRCTAAAAAASGGAMRAGTNARATQQRSHRSAFDHRPKDNER